MYHYTSMRMAGRKIPENNIKYWRGCGTIGTFIHCLGRPQIGTTILENSLTLTTKTKNTLQHGQNISLSIFYPIEIQLQETYTRMITAALFLMASEYKFKHPFTVNV